MSTGSGSSGVTIDFDTSVWVEYEVDDPCPEGKVHPITIKKVLMRGEKIDHLLHVGHIMQLQRRIHNRLLDEEFAKGEQTAPTRFG